MRQQGSKYSRMIAWLKILLPLAALALLSTTFLLSRDVDPAVNVPIAGSTDPDGVLREQATDPYFAGTTNSGGALTMTAKTARPVPGSDEVEADTLDATIVLKDGSEILLKAPLANLSDKRDDAQLSGGVIIISSTGYTLNTDSLNAMLSKVEAESLGAVEGNGPAGHLTAGRMRITSGDTGEDVQLLFTDGVRMIYDPKTE
ncbi:LPS export ABC transporter periplasmic protein LptC [Puniceibacterium sediminis]|uniref:Lipopolysaccharide export system protein LptC n=1 Tax=Puniceibacterium sediminis TaxID=1608407 RepID=A0A238VWI8_9RHOB|nr:LPS export ABC transporter periplasmic protein LptC [Puniceibacterium sediminis]SNR38551.1 lipopolysaccharide export system protein LptC [Puniceibacterium sediminis]